MLSGLLIQESVSEVIFYPFERLLLSKDSSHSRVIFNIFEALVQSGRNDPVGVDPWSS